MPTIITKIEGQRGCGYRKEGGLYFVSDGSAEGCCKLPHELTVCPVCNNGVHFSRSFQWITTALFKKKKCTKELGACIMAAQNTKIGLLWCGEMFYQSADHFIREANRMGISKRFSQLPKGFELGVTWIALAHRKAIPVQKGKNVIFKPGIFRLFKPQRIEYIIKGTETEEQLDRLEKRGFTLINVIRDIDSQTEANFEQPIN